MECPSIPRALSKFAETYAEADKAIRGQSKIPIYRSTQMEASGADTDATGRTLLSGANLVADGDR